MANATVRAIFNISGMFQYKSGTSAANFPGSLGPQTVQLDTDDVTKAFANISFTIPAGSDYTLDVANFIDGLSAATNWTSIQIMILEHNSASLATGGIDLTGVASNAIPKFRGSKLLPGEGCVPFYSVSTTGFAFTSPASRLVIENLDSAHDATVDLFLLGR